MEGVRINQKSLNILLYIFICLGVGLINEWIQQSGFHPTYNQGRYSYELNQTNSEKTVVQGQVIDLKSGQAIQLGFVSFPCNQFSTDANGNFIFELPYSETDSISLEIRALGYRSMETKYFRFKTGEGITLKVLLEEDNRPIIHCEM